MKLESCDLLCRNAVAHNMFMLFHARGKQRRDLAGGGRGNSVTSAVPSKPDASFVGELSPVGSVTRLLNLWLLCTSEAWSSMSAFNVAIFLSNISQRACTLDHAL